MQSIVCGAVTTGTMIFALALPATGTAEVVTETAGSIRATKATRTTTAGAVGRTAAAAVVAQADAGGGLPSSRDNLFGTDTPADGKTPSSRDELFGADPEPAEAASTSKDDLFGLSSNDGDAGSKKPQQTGLVFRGFVQQETAYTYADPAHWSRASLRGQIGTTGKLGDNIKWKATLRGFIDPLYFGSEYYPTPVRHDERSEALIGETYIDTSLKGVELRLGRQNIIWGEMVGLFFADVVSAKDLRSFVLPSFDIIRIPQWAARAEHFFGNSHVEFVWIPYNTYDNIGKPGAEFYPMQIPAPVGFTQQFRAEAIPARSIANSNYGGRFSTLQNGWDLTAFYYRSTDATATFYRDIDPFAQTITWQARHDRIWQAGGTMSKDLGTAVLKGEAVYTDGRSFNVTRPTEATGVVRQNTWDWALGLDFNLPRDIRLNLQGFQRIYQGHDRDLIHDHVESGATVLVNAKVFRKWEAEVLLIHSLNRSEYLVRPKMIWKVQPNLRVAFGVDVFDGPVTGVLGRYRDRDRVYVETRYDF